MQYHLVKVQDSLAPVAGASGAIREGPVMTIVSRGGVFGRAELRWWARFIAQLDILALITLGLTRNRRVLSRRSISAVASVMAVARRSGG